MPSFQDNLDGYFQRQPDSLERFESLVPLERSMAPWQPLLIVLASASGAVKALHRTQAGLAGSIVLGFTAELCRRLADAEHFSSTITVDDRAYEGFGLRIGGAARGGLLGVLLPADDPSYNLDDAGRARLRAAAELAWLAAERQNRIEELEAGVRQWLAERETLAAAHTEAMLHVVEVQEKRVQELRERQLMEQSFAATEAANRAKTRFLANMSHEIRTPLNAILGFTELLRAGADEGREEERQEYLETVFKSASHLLALIDDILDISRIEADQMRIEIDSCSPKEIVAVAVTNVVFRARQKGLPLACHWHGPVPAQIRTDPLRAQQLLTNLLANAVKFTVSGSVSLSVTLVEGPSGPLLEFAVADTGVGIPADKLDAIFQPFVQLDNSITREHGGSGLGLAISRQIARILGGDVTVRSEVGKGSVFTASIATGPLDSVAMASNGTESITPVALPPQQPACIPAGTKVLLVEDGEDNRRFAQIVLERAGAAVETAENGRLGVRKAIASAYDIVLMDMQMPVMDGYSAARTLRDLGYSVPIVALTAHAMNGDKEKCLEAGCSAYLSKPLSPDGLVRCIERCLKGPDEPEPASASSAPAVGPPLYSSLPADDHDFRDIVEKFAARVKEQVRAMGSALIEGDLPAIARLAHAIKGTAGTVGFECFTDPAARLEKAARQDDPGGAAAPLAEIRSLAARIALPQLTDSR